MIGFSSLSNEEWMLVRHLSEAYQDGKISRIFGISLVTSGNRLMVYNGNFNLRHQDYDLLRKLEKRDLVEIRAVASTANNNNWLIQLKDSLLALAYDRI